MDDDAFVCPNLEWERAIFLVTYNLYRWHEYYLWHCVWICFCFFSMFLLCFNWNFSEYEQWIHYCRVHVPAAIASYFRFDLPKVCKILSHYFALQINDKRSLNRIRSPRKSEIEVSQFIDQCFQAHNEYRSKHKVPPLILSKKVRNLFKILLWSQSERWKR